MRNDPPFTSPQSCDETAQELLGAVMDGELRGPQTGPEPIGAVFDRLMPLLERAVQEQVE